MNSNNCKGKIFRRYIMERFNFKTRFKRKFKWELPEIMKICDRNGIEFVTSYVTPYDNEVVIVSCDERTYYDVFVKLVEKKYPSVCDFDV